ncbi:MAG: hypothetical protein KIS92_17335 [Planctomycetota bacterium]|nr:hypothetical protein [Planctomycetota bacterium]
MRSAKKAKQQKDLPAVDPNKRVLVVSEHPAMREALATCLRSQGCAVDTAGFGSGAQDCYRHASYRLVVVDLPDPEPDPEDFHELVCMLSAAPCEAIDDPAPERQAFSFGDWLPVHPNIGNRPAFIILSRSADQETHGQAFLHEQLIGALAKPVRKDFLLDLAQELMDLERSLRAERMGYELQ